MLTTGQTVVTPRHGAVLPTFNPKDERYSCCGAYPPRIGFIAAGIDIALSCVLLVASIALALASTFQGYRSRVNFGSFGAVFAIVIASAFIMGLKRQSAGWILVYIVAKVVGIIIECIILILLFVTIAALQATSSHYKHQATTITAVFGTLAAFFIVMICFDICFLVIAVRCRRFYSDKTMAEHARIVQLNSGVVAGPGGGISNVSYVPTFGNSSGVTTVYTTTQMTPPPNYSDAVGAPPVNTPAHSTMPGYPVYPDTMK